MNRTSFGLIAWLSSTRIQLPLTHVESRFTVTGEIAVVEMEQIFEQNARQSLDVTYTFPLPGSAAVFRCEMIVNGRTTRAVVMEEVEARRVVEEKKAAGHRTALVEVERDNLFTLQLGNAAPGDHIVIRLAYFEALERLGTQLSLRLPFSPGVRYIPGKPLLRANRGRGSVDDTDEVPDASRLTPPRITRQHPDAATLYVHGEFDAAEVASASLKSPTHAAVVLTHGDHVEVELALAEEAPDRDFVLRWEEKTALEPQPRVWTTAHGEDVYALLQIRAPQPSQTAVVQDSHAQDIYFLLDRSGSMDGMKWQKCAEALHAFVRELGSQDRVWITCFESSYQDFAEKLMTRNQLLADKGFQTLARLGTGGGTELLPALEHVLAIRRAKSAERPSRLILITDGQVGNEPAVLNLMQQPAHAALPVHCFGIDDAVNDAFLKSLARQTGGRCALMTPSDDIPAAVRSLAVSLRRPVLTHLQIEGDSLMHDDITTLRDLHAGDVALVPLRLRAGGSLNPVITAKTPDGSSWRQSFALQSAGDGTGSPAARLLWAQRRITHLMDNGQQPAAVQVAISHNLSCQGASFVAWDEAEKVPVAQFEVHQPSQGSDTCMLAAGGAGKVNFFEGNSAEYSKKLKECSDDELVADICFSPPPAPRRRRWSSGSEVDMCKVEDSELNPMSATPVAIDDVSLRYESWELVQASSVKDWAQDFSHFLQSLGLSMEQAIMVTVICYSWSRISWPTVRSRTLKKLLAAMKLSQTPLVELAGFVSRHLPKEHEGDIRRFFPWPESATPKVSRKL